MITPTLNNTQIIFLAMIPIILLSFVVRKRFNKDWQQLLWSYFGVIALALAMVGGLII